MGRRQGGGTVAAAGVAAASSAGQGARTAVVGVDVEAAFVLPGEQTAAAAAAAAAAVVVACPSAQEAVRQPGPLVDPPWEGELRQGGHCLVGRLRQVLLQHQAVGSSC